jgi:hypothetical protein
MIAKSEGVSDFRIDKGIFCLEAGLAIERYPTVRQCEDREKIVRWVSGAAHRARCWTVKRPDGLMIDGAHYFFRIAFLQGVLVRVLRFGSNSLLADPETLSVSASFIVIARGL